MSKKLKTRPELAEMMMAAAQACGKCEDLHSVTINGPLPGRSSNWDFGCSWKSKARSPQCGHELRLIAGRLQGQFDLSDH